MMLLPSMIAALVARCHGKVTLSADEERDSRLLTIEESRNERGELVLETHEPEKLGPCLMVSAGEYVTP